MSRWAITPLLVSCPVHSVILWDRKTWPLFLLETLSKTLVQWYLFQYKCWLYFVITYQVIFEVSTKVLIHWGSATAIFGRKLVQLQTVGRTIHLVHKATPNLLNRTRFVPTVPVHLNLPEWLGLLPLFSPQLTGKRGWCNLQIQQSCYPLGSSEALWEPRCESIKSWLGLECYSFSCSHSCFWDSRSKTSAPLLLRSQAKGFSSQSRFSGPSFCSLCRLFVCLVNMVRLKTLEDQKEIYSRANHSERISWVRWLLSCHFSFESSKPLPIFSQ